MHRSQVFEIPLGDKYLREARLAPEPAAVSVACVPPVVMARMDQDPWPVRALFVALMILGFLCVPLWPVVIWTQTKDPSYCRRYFRTIGRCFRSLFMMVLYGSLTRSFHHMFLRHRQYTRRHRTTMTGACLRCGKCCQAIRCPAVEYDAQSGSHRCKSFGSAYWHFGPCSKFPVSPLDVEAHGCPGFAFGFPHGRQRKSA